MGKILIVVGIISVIAGLVLQFAPQTFSWFGKFWLEKLSAATFGNEKYNANPCMLLWALRPDR